MATVFDVINENRVRLLSSIEFNNHLFDHLRELEVFSLHDVEQIKKKQCDVPCDMASEILMRLEKRNDWSSINKFCYALRKTNQEHLVTSHMRGNKWFVKLHIQISISIKDSDSIDADSTARIVNKMIDEDKTIDPWDPKKCSSSLIAPFRDVIEILDDYKINIACYSPQAELELYNMHGSLSKRVITYYNDLFRDRPPLSPDEIIIRFQEVQRNPETIAIKGTPQEIGCEVNEIPRSSHEVLEDILKKTCTVDSFVYLLSIVGLKQTGKSFLLNYLMRYFQALETSNKANWMVQEGETLSGFKWSNSGNPTTTGLVVWDRPFTVKNIHGKEVKIVLLDTEGYSEDQKETGSIILKLVARLATGEILNLKSPVKKGNFERIKQVTPARQGLHNRKSCILVRDHKIKKFSHGSSKGQKFLEKMSEMSPSEIECWDCFLLPYPGQGVDDVSEEEEDENYRGCHSVFTEEFRKHLEEFFEYLTNDIRTAETFTGRYLLKLHESEPLPQRTWLQVNPLPGSPVRLVAFSNNMEDTKSAFSKGLFLDIEAMCKVFKKSDERPVAFVSLSGAGRQGKSFFLNYILRYLWALELGKGESWFEDTKTPLTGFPWSSGEQPVTEGIVVWDHPFTIPLGEGNKIAVVVLDTQGQFDQYSSNSKMNIMLALSTLLTTVQVYNVGQRINECDLEALEDIIHAGMEVKEGYVQATLSSVKEKAKNYVKGKAKSTAKWFGKKLNTEDSLGSLVDKVETEQECSDRTLVEGSIGTRSAELERLVFLVRDWCSTMNYEYGSSGGQKYLKMKLKVDDTHEENKLVRQNIHTCFKDVKCFLMPDPGKNAKGSQKDFDGRLSDLEEDFRTHLLHAVPFIVEKEFFRHSKNADSGGMLMRDIQDALEMYVESLRCTSKSVGLSARQGRLLAQDTLAFKQEVSSFREIIAQDTKGLSTEGFTEFVEREKIKVTRRFQSNIRCNEMKKDTMQQFKELLDNAVTLCQKEKEEEQRRIKEEINRYNASLVTTAVTEYVTQAKRKHQDLCNADIKINIESAIRNYADEIRRNAAQIHVKFKGTTDTVRSWQARLEESLETQTSLMVAATKEIQIRHQKHQEQHNQRIIDTHWKEFSEKLKEPNCDICEILKEIKAAVERDLRGTQEIQQLFLTNFVTRASVETQSLRVEKQRAKIEQLLSWYRASVSQCTSDYDTNKLREIHKRSLRECIESLDALSLAPKEAEDVILSLKGRCMFELRRIEATIKQNQEKKEEYIQGSILEGKMSYFAVMKNIGSEDDIFTVVEKHSTVMDEIFKKFKQDDQFQENVSEVLTSEFTKYVEVLINERKGSLEHCLRLKMEQALNKAAEKYCNHMDTIYTEQRKFRSLSDFEEDHSSAAEAASIEVENLMDRFKLLENITNQNSSDFLDEVHYAWMSKQEQLKSEYEAQNRLNNPFRKVSVLETFRRIILKFFEQYSRKR